VSTHPQAQHKPRKAHPERWSKGESQYKDPHEYFIKKKTPFCVSWLREIQGDARNGRISTVNTLSVPFLGSVASKSEREREREREREKEKRDLVLTSWKRNLNP